MPGGVFECPDWYDGCGAIWTSVSTARKAPRHPEIRVCPDCEKGAGDE
jgi:hypothetical protein